MRLFARSLAELWRGPLIAGLVIALFLPIAVVSYQGIDLTAFEALPESLRRIMGIADGASADILAYTLVLGTYGGLTLASVAIAICANAAAGDEQSRVLPLVLATPVSRLRYIATRAAAAVTVVVAMCLLVLAASLVTPQLLDVEVGQAHLVAQWLHLLGAVGFHGFLAFAIAAATGRKSLASAVAAIVMVMGLFLAGLLPQMEATEDWAEWVPWAWLEGSQPILNGVDGVQLALLGGGFLAFVLVGLVGFPRRDLRNFDTGGLLDRLAGAPLIGRLLRAGSLIRSRGILSHTLGRSLTLTLIVTAVMGLLMGLAMGPLFASMEDQLGELSESMSPELLVLFGAGDFSSAEGFYQAETLGMIAPIAVIVVGVVMAASLAGEERARRAGLLLAQPVSRFTVWGAVALSMVIHVLIVSLATAAGIWGGSAVAGLGMDPVKIAVSGLLLFGLGLAISAVALAVASATGSPGAAVWTATAVAVLGHFANALLSMNPDTEQWAAISPFNWYGAVNPLAEFPDPLRVVALFAMAAVLILLSYPLYQRRDLRLG